MPSQIPNTMKAVVIEKSGDPLAIKEIPVPQPSPGEVLIKVQACGVCHSDAALQQGHMNALYVNSFHSFSTTSSIELYNHMLYFFSFATSLEDISLVS